MLEGEKVTIHVIQIKLCRFFMILYKFWIYLLCIKWKLIAYVKQKLWHTGRGNIQVIITSVTLRTVPVDIEKRTLAVPPLEGCSLRAAGSHAGFSGRVDKDKDKNVEKSRIEESREMRRKQIYISLRICTFKASLITGLFTIWIYLLKSTWAVFSSLFAL